MLEPPLLYYWMIPLIIWPLGPCFVGSAGRPHLWEFYHPSVQTRPWKPARIWNTYPFLFCICVGNFEEGTGT